MAVPELSVLLTAYNSGLYIREAINSILNQTYTDYELIIIDDGSTDNTVNIIQSFNDIRIHFFAHPRNMGIARTRNHALEQASGSFLSFLDSDDIAHPQKFEKQIAFLKNNSNFGLVGSSVILINEQGTETGRWKLAAKPEMIPSIMLFHNYFVNSAVTFRKALLNDIRYPEELVIGEDYIMWFYLLQKAKGLNLPEYLISYRQHPESLIQRTAEKKEEYDKKVYDIILNKIGIQPTGEEYAIHLSLKNSERISSLAQMKKTFAWLQKISQSYHKASFLSDQKICPVILNRWLKVCFKGRRKPGLLMYGIARIMFNPKLFFSCRSKKQ